MTLVSAIISDAFRESNRVAAVAQAGTWFKISKIGESSEVSLGAWT